MNIIIAGLGASLGAILRYFITNYGKKHWEELKKHYLNLPFPTLVINLTGTLILGFIFGMKVNSFFYALVGTGVMGGYTTFSTLNTELVALYHSKNYSGLVLYALASYVGGLILVYVGYDLGRLF